MRILLDEPELFIDLYKARGRKKGSQNKNHRYIMRFLVVGANGQLEWEHVYPKKEHVESYEPGKGYKLKEGVTFSQIVNEHLFGGPTGKVDKLTGKPEVKDGYFFSYVARRSNAAIVKRGHKDPIDVEKIGDWRIYKYQKRPGMVGAPELGDGVERAYTVPKKVTALIITDKEVNNKVVTAEEQVGAAQAYAPGSGIAEGKPIDVDAEALDNETGEAVTHQLRAGDKLDHPSHGSLTVLSVIGDDVEAETKTGKKVHLRASDMHLTKRFKRYFRVRVLPQKHDMAPRGTVNLFVVPDRTPDTTTAIAEPTPVELDFLPSTEELVKNPKAVIGKVPEWVIDKFSDGDKPGEEKFQSELQRYPVTTAVTLGRTKLSSKMVEQLTKEWQGKFNRMIREKVLPAFNTTFTAQFMREHDEAKGRNPYASDKGAYRQYLNAKFDDLMQEANTALLETLVSYKADQDPGHRFDKLAYQRVMTHLLSKTREEAMRDNAETIVDETQMEEALAHASQPVSFLSPEEGFELREYKEQAQRTLKRVLYDKTFPEAYRRVFLAQLWLDSPQSAADEEATIEHRRKMLGSGKAGRESAKKYRRDFTGDRGITSVYKEWVDPKTGDVVDISQYSESHQRRLLSQWADAAQEELLRRLSKPTSEIKVPEAERASRTVQVRAAAGTPPTLLQNIDEHGIPQQRIADTMESRVLTREGVVLKRWLELERKLVMQNRRRGTVRVGIDEVTMQPERGITVRKPTRDEKRGAKTKPTPMKTTLVVPGRVADAGAGILSIPVDRGAKPHPAVSFFTQPENESLARRLGLRLHELQTTHTDKKLHSRGQMATEALHARPNVTLGTRAQAHLDAASKFHNTLMEIEQLSPKKLAQRLDDAKKHAKKVQALGSWTVDASGTRQWQAGKDGGIQAFHDAAVAVQKLASAIDAKSRAAAKVRAEHKRTTLPESWLQEKIKPLEVTQAERDALGRAQAHLEDLATKVTRVYPEIAHAYADIVRTGRAIDHEHLAEHKAYVDMMQRDARNAIALLEHETERRAVQKRMQKSLNVVVYAPALLEAIDDYVFELKRLAVEIIN